MYVLKDLWEGNITPADRGYRKGSPYAGLVHQANESEDEFYNHLSDAGKKAYQVYCDQQAHVEDVKDCDTFIRGVAAEPRCRKIDGVVCRRAPRNLSQNE